MLETHWEADLPQPVHPATALATPDDRRCRTARERIEWTLTIYGDSVLFITVGSPRRGW